MDLNIEACVNLLRERPDEAKRVYKENVALFKGPVRRRSAQKIKKAKIKKIVNLTSTCDKYADTNPNRGILPNDINNERLDLLYKYLFNSRVPINGDYSLQFREDFDGNNDAINDNENVINENNANGFDNENADELMDLIFNPVPGVNGNYYDLFGYHLPEELGPANQEVDLNFNNV